MNNLDKILNYLPLGYLYLVVIGIIRECLLFYQLGINILHFSSVMDILISPIATVMSHPLVLGTIALTTMYPWYVYKQFMKNSQKSWVKKLHQAKKSRDEMTENEIQEYGIWILVRTFGILLLCIFVGYAVAQGHGIKSNLKDDTLKYTHRINYNSGDSADVFIITSNSQYTFVIPKSSKHIEITPIASVKNIELIKNKMIN